MIDCPNGEVRDQLPDLLHDRLAPDARRIVEAHVASCALCQEELELLRGLRASLHRAPSVNVASIVSALPAPARTPGRRSWVGWRVAAAITLVAAGGTSVAVVQRGLVGQGDSVAVGALSDTPRVALSESVPGVPTPARIDPPAPATSASAATRAAPRELAVGTSAVGDLSDQELSALLKEIETLDAVPSADVESAAPITPVAPKVRGEG